MARLKNSTLSNKSKRLALEISKTPYYETLANGASIGYRRNQASGSWVARRYTGGTRVIKVLGIADDFQDADGISIFTYAQAHTAALAFDPQQQLRNDEEVKRKTAVDAIRVTVGYGLDVYQADLRIRGSEVVNATRVRKHVDAELSAIAIVDLTKTQMRKWRDDLLEKKLAPATVDRLCNGLRAALNLVADRAPAGETISRDPWEYGLKAVGGSQEARNVILSQDAVKTIITACYGQGLQFGLYVETLAQSGARSSQAARLKVRSMLGGVHDPKLLMPRSKKGKSGKDLTAIPIPITAGLATKLQAEAMGRDDDESLLLKDAPPRSKEQIKAGIVLPREPWNRHDHIRHFRRAVKAAFKGQDKVGKYPIAEITIYALRHTSIVRQLMQGVPIRVVASQHDTSVAMIEKHYSAHITDVADSIVRGTLQAF